MRTTRPRESNRSCKTDARALSLDRAGTLIRRSSDDTVYTSIVEPLRSMMVVVRHTSSSSSYNLQKQCAIFAALNELFFESFGRNTVFSHRATLERREYLTLKERRCSDQEAQTMLLFHPFFLVLLHAIVPTSPLSNLFQSSLPM